MDCLGSVSEVQILLLEWQIWVTEVKAEQRLKPLPFNKDQIVFVESKVLISLDHAISAQVKFDDLFAWVCHQGDLETAQWVRNELANAVNLQSLNEILQDLCREGHFHLIEWFLGTFAQVSPHSCGQAPFEEASKSGHLYLLQWLLFNFDPYREMALASKNYRWWLSQACQNGHYDVAKWLLGSFPEVKVMNFDYTFAQVCGRGHLTIAQLLLTEFSINPRFDEDSAFCNACKYNHLHIAMWLKSKCPMIDQHLRYDYFFRKACENGYLDLAQWLFSLGEIKVNALERYALRYSAYNGHWDTLRWLLSVIPKLSSKDWETVFVWACYGNQLKLAQWISTRFRYTRYLGKAKEYAEKGDASQVLEWLNDSQRQIEFKPSRDSSSNGDTRMRLRWINTSLS